MGQSLAIEVYNYKCETFSANTDCLSIEFVMVFSNVGAGRSTHSIFLALLIILCNWDDMITTTDIMS